MSKDPNQWKNLTEDSKYEVAKEELKKWLPKINAAHYRAETPTERQKGKISLSPFEPPPRKPLIKELHEIAEGKVKDQ